MNDLFAPVRSEIPSAAAAIVQGALPADLPRGAVLKNGPNANHGDQTGGWLDGDSMVHCVVLPPIGSDPCFSRTYLRTSGFAKEEAAGRRLFDGSLVAPRGWPLLWGLLCNAVRASQPQKDTANTAFLKLAGGGGRVLGLMEQCLPCEFRVGRDATLTTVRPNHDFDGVMLDRARFPFAGGACTAHFKTDPRSGESIGVTYCSNGPPAARIDRFDSRGQPATPVIVPLPGDASCMIHDSAITDGSSRSGGGSGGGGSGGSAGSSSGGYVLVLDFSLTVRPRRLIADAFPVAYEPEVGSRVGLVRRAIDGRVPEEPEVSWAAVAPCVVLHTVNAHERTDGLVALTALRSEPASPSSFIEAYSPAFLHRWLLDPSTGTCLEEKDLSDVPIEFPTIDARLTGRDARFGFGIRPNTIGGPNRYGPPFEGILINGVVKYDLRSGELRGDWTLPSGWHVVSECTFVPKIGSEAGDGDRGYLLVFATRSSAGAEREMAEEVAAAAEDGGRASRLYVLDAEALDGTPRGDETDMVANAGVEIGR